MRLFIAGHKGLVGSALVRRFSKEDVTIITKPREELNLANQKAVQYFFQTEQIDTVILAAAKVGGILANSTYPGQFIYDNLIIASNVIHQAFLGNVKNLIFLGSSCIYPKHAQQPMNEDQLLTGPLEPTNEPYAIAKIAGLKLAEYYRKQYGVNFYSLMPTNLYGPNDNYNLETSHVVPALIRKFYEAKDEVEIWGTGNVKREFMHVDDLADACAFCLNLKYNPDLLNVGTGEDCTIKELVEIIQNVSKFKGTVKWNTSKPDGTPRKLLDVSRINNLGWKAKIDLKSGLEQTYNSYINERYNPTNINRVLSKISSNI
jgi:GDP-L-fucose synthase